MPVVTLLKREDAKTDRRKDIEVDCANVVSRVRNTDIRASYRTTPFVARCDYFGLLRAAKGARATHPQQFGEGYYRIHDGDPAQEYGPSFIPGLIFKCKIVPPCCDLVGLRPRNPAFTRLPHRRHLYYELDLQLGPLPQVRLPR